MMQLTQQLTAVSQERLAATQHAGDPVQHLNASLSAATGRQEQLQSALQQAVEGIGALQAEKHEEEQTRGACASLLLVAGLTSRAGSCLGLG